MRDPQRIDVILAKLRVLWSKHPDQRLGQLICNLTRDDETGSLKSSGHIFIVEDDEMSALIGDTNKHGWEPRLKSYNFDKK